MSYKEKREEAVKFALNLNTFGGVEPSNKCIELLNDYIEGKSIPEENIEQLKKYYESLSKSSET